MKIIAGPCVIESMDLLREVAAELARIKKELDVEIYFKASFDKANRTSLSSFRGPGIEEGIAMLETIRDEFGLPITTDFHTPEQIASHGHRVDIIQIPAFLCRQTDMLLEAGKTGKIVNIKKAQFLNAEKMQFAVDKVKSTGNDQVWLTERGTLFGPSELVVDFRNIQKLAALTDYVSWTVRTPRKKPKVMMGRQEVIGRMYLISQKRLNFGGRTPFLLKRIQTPIRGYQTAPIC